jgi:hypothetical protein
MMSRLVVNDCTFPLEPEPKTVQEYMDAIFGEPTPTWSLTDFADCFVYLRRAFKYGWRFRKCHDLRFVAIHKPNGSGWHATDGVSCNCERRAFKADSCSHSEIARRAGGVEMISRVLSQFRFDGEV